MNRSNRVRIIGGKWKRRQLAFPDLPHLRPTPDAVRETLFNWLQFELPGKRCLDLFAGSGAIGFEAASRGAAQTVLVEGNRRAARSLQENRDLLDANEEIAVTCADALDFLRCNTQHFDIVFLDPPFQSDLLARSCRLLAKGGHLSPGALIYIEAPKTQDPLPIAADWPIIRTSHRGALKFHLLRYGN
ncbi:MAG: 16S rRNA (guanine(966)-N(2))-methyltransferase RsmD [Pseudomonadota bacterium]|nr:16S rRNA (guanine(966)-N(2))-methyltransferase RsmD [Pseudomonadota bacterium]